MKAVFIEAKREGYEPGQVYETMTIGELADVFQHIARQEGEEALVYLRHDGGYTYGGITSWCLEVEEIDDEEED